MARGIRIGNQHGWLSEPLLVFSPSQPTTVNLATYVYNPKNKTLVYAVAAGYALPSGATLSGSVVTWTGSGTPSTTPVKFTITYGGVTQTSSLASAVILVPDTTPPSIPTGLAATVMGATQINLVWNASTDPSVVGAATSGLANYKVYRGGVNIASPTGALYPNTGLSPSTQYTYNVSAVDAAGNESPQSSSVQATTSAASGDLVHGGAFTVVGSFPARTAQTPSIWDNCSHGESLFNRWTYRWHDPGETANEETYRTPAQAEGVALPHSNVTRYLCGRHDGAGSNSADVYVGTRYTRPAASYWSVWSCYVRVGPNFPHGQDDNHKLQYFSNATGYAATGTYGYIEYENSGWNSSTATGFKISWHDVTGVGSSPQFNDLGAYPVNQQQDWYKRDWVIRWSQTSNGRWIYRANATTLANLTFRTDTIGSGPWNETLGGYSRLRGSTAWRYFADILHHRDASHPGRLYLTNSATFPSSIYEVQPWTSWSTTSVTMTCNKGRLSSGTVHLHYVDELNGNSYLGTRTMT